MREEFLSNQEIRKEKASLGFEKESEVIELFTEVDGNFPNHHPDPSVLENMADLISAVDEHNADLGLAFDGDGDRLGVITDAGQVIWPDPALFSDR